MQFTQLRGLGLENTRISRRGAGPSDGNAQPARPVPAGDANHRSGIEIVAQIPALERLTLDRTQITDAGLVPLKDMPHPPVSWLAGDDDHLCGSKSTSVTCPWRNSIWAIRRSAMRT